MNTKYGVNPQVLGWCGVLINEMMAYMYMPIKMIGEPTSSIANQLEPRLQCFTALIEQAIEHFGRHDACGHYIYITAKHGFVSPGCPGNRPGYHCDGFLSDDINYIWYDKEPTVFCIQDYDITDDHILSLGEFDRQSDPVNEVTYPAKTLLCLDPFVVHRTPDIEEAGMRTFVKISFSKERYNLVGNSINPLIDYKWPMFARELVRNRPIYNEVDFYK